MRAIWKGAVSFGLVNVPVRLFAATQEHDIRFQQVHPIMYGRTYYLEPEARAAKPYVLLREALEATQRLAVVKVAMRQRESLAVLRVRDRVIVLQTLLWPDEVRTPDFDILDTDVDLRPQELTMAQSLIESLASDFEPDAFEDEYATALSEMVDAKLEGAPPIPAAEVESGASTEVVDLLTALQRSVEKARASRGEDGEAPAPAVAAAKTAAKKAPAKTAAAKTAAAKTGTAKTAAAKTTASRTSASKTTAAKTTAAKATPAKKAPAKSAEKAAPAKRARK